MQFKPFNDEEIENEGRLEPGEYNFIISEVIEKKSQSGNDMLVLHVEISNNNGKTLIIKDHIVSTVRWKLSQVAKALGEDICEKLKQGTLTAYDLKGKEGRCVTQLETKSLPVEGPNGEQRMEQKSFLKIHEYLKGGPIPFQDDEIPF